MLSNCEDRRMSPECSWGKRHGRQHGQVATVLPLLTEQLPCGSERQKSGGGWRGGKTRGGSARLHVTCVLLLGKWG